MCLNLTCRTGRLSHEEGNKTNEEVHLKTYGNDDEVPQSYYWCWTARQYKDDTKIQQKSTKKITAVNGSLATYPS